MLFKSTKKEDWITFSNPPSIMSKKLIDEVRIGRVVELEN